MTKDQELVEKIVAINYHAFESAILADHVSETSVAKETIKVCRQHDMQMAIDIVPDMGEEPDQDKYPCEWVLWAERERVREAIRERFSDGGA